ncbi:MAG: aldehyde dehydrogenase (NADP(+)) [Acidobacteria bacterium]|nr:aldehyde dehydrogenase (NADP(+)) [Acidobacteriota bacterium]
MEAITALTGTAILGSQRGSRSSSAFRAVNPATGQAIAPDFYSSTHEEVDRAAHLATQAFSVYAWLSGRDKARFLRHIADSLQAATDALVARAHEETALPKPRLIGETARTANQLRLFADLIEEGSWLMARIDTADPARTPLPKPDIRSMLRPLGPVAVFGASNFPLAFSVAGGDTASALAAGNPVIVKAHPAHPGTSELVGRIIAESVRACGLPEGVFSLLFDSGIAVGKALVQHPLVKAVGFTGSLQAGRALMDLAAARPEPIPCFTEMSSVNPVFILPGAFAQQGQQIATGLAASFTLGAGQFCTKPGLVFLPGENAAFTTELQQRVIETPAFTMLTSGIARHYAEALRQREAGGHAQRSATATSVPDTASFAATAKLDEVELSSFLNNPELQEEVFGPAALLIRCTEPASFLSAAEALRGSLTATIFGTEADLLEHQALVRILERKAGRLLFNGFPTGVEVCHAMVHGGPYPATADGRSTSVGTQAIFRFSRPVCYQQFPDAALPEELRSANPAGILRLVNGSYTREPV